MAIPFRFQWRGFWHGVLHPFQSGEQKLRYAINLAREIKEAQGG